jgi:hypothetical protein
VAGRWVSDSSSFDDCQYTKTSSEHPDQACARTKIRDRDRVFPWNGERQEPEGSERKLAQAGKLFYSGERAANSSI